MAFTTWSGNVWEWCSTKTAPGRYELKGSAFTSPLFRGEPAAWNDANDFRQDDDTGFRCACTPDQMASTSHNASSGAYVMVVELSTFLGAIGAAAGKAAASEGFKLLRDLVGLQTAQEKLLRSVDAKLELLLAGPFRTGCYRLQDAQSAKDEQDRLRLLHDAQRSFTEALGQDDEPMCRSLAALHLAVIGLALGSEDLAKRNLHRAHIEAFKAIIAAKKREQERPLSRRHRLQERINAQEKRQRRLKSELLVLEFANKLAETRRAWGSKPQEAPLVISQAGKDTAGQSDEVAEVARQIARWRFMSANLNSDIPREIIANIDPPGYVVGDKREAYDLIRQRGLVTSSDIFNFWLPRQEAPSSDG